MPEARQLLSFLSLLGPEPVPRWLLAEGHDLLPPPLAGAAAPGAEAMEPAGRALQKRGLLVGSDVGYRVPEGVRDAVRSGLTAVERARMRAAALRVLNAAFPDAVDRPESRDRCERLAGHILAVARGPWSGGRATEEAVHLLARLGSWHRMEERAESAREVLERALEVAEGTDPPAGGFLRAAIADELALTRVTLGDDAGARRMAEHALEIAGEMRSEDALRLPVLLDNVGTTFRELGDLERAAACFRRGLRLADRPTSLAVELRLHLADVEMMAGAFGEARELAGGALRAAERLWGEDHPQVSRAVWMRADALRSLGEADRAAEAYRRSLLLEERRHGPGHPAVAQRAMGLGLHLEEAGDPDAAREQYRRALGIFEEAFGPDADPSRSVRACLERVAGSR